MEDLHTFMEHDKIDKANQWIQNINDPVLPKVFERKNESESAWCGYLVADAKS